jgi:uncharacterized protein
LRRVLIDANVFIYALGAEHRYRGPCRAIVAALASGQLPGETSVEILQEVVHVRRRRKGGSDAAARAREILAWELPVHEFDVDDLERALGLIDRHEGLPVRDAVHAAMALNREIDAVLSTDGDFDLVEGLARIDPADAPAVEALQRSAG